MGPFRDYLQDKTLHTNLLQTLILNSDGTEIEIMAKGTHVSSSFQMGLKFLGAWITSTYQKPLQQHPKL
jgi:hypothetical protein